MHIRQATNQDLASLKSIAQEMGARHETGYFERCLREQAEGKRALYIIPASGYAQLIWSPKYPLFRRLSIPEIQDLNVVPAARRQGLGRLLVAHCEEEARKAGREAVGISVGLSPAYGAAQRLYIKQGYVPDGAGIAYDDLTLTTGDMRPLDDLLTLKLVKDL